MKTPFRGEMGHIAVTTCNVERAIAYLRSKGFETDPESIKYKNGKMIAAYLKDSFGGFAVHLVRQ